MNIVEVTVEFAFEAAHWLPHVADEHKCKRMHGHSYKVAVTVAGPVGDDGMVMDYADIKSAAGPVIKGLDHRTLNDFITNPTCEHICIWLWFMIQGSQLTGELPGLAAVMVRETDHAYCTYRGPA